MEDTRTIDIPGIVDQHGRPLPMPMDKTKWHRDWYPQVLAHRIRVNEATKGNDRISRRARDAHIALCSQPGAAGTLYYANTFGWILEPRNDASSMRLPFITFPRQAELLQEYDRMDATEAPDALANMMMIKARTVGGTWISALRNIKRWRFDPYWFSAVVSADEHLVNDLKNPKAYFWKMKFMLTNQHEWLLPEGFRGFYPRAPHTTWGVLENPATGSVINGSTTTSDALRGDRRGEVTLDECGTYDDFDAIWNNMANVTYHIVGITSAQTKHGMGCYNLVHGKDGYTKPRLFFFKWDDVPGRGRRWFEGMKSTMKQDEFQREVLMEWFAGSGEFVYPQVRDREVGNFPFVPGWPVRVAMDDGWKDNTAISWYQKDLARGRWRCIAAYQNSGQPIRFYGHILTGTPHSSFRWTREEFELMEWIRECSLFEAIFYGDRHGANTEMTSGKSIFDVLSEEFGIYVISAMDPTRNDISYRIDAVQENLPHLDFDRGHGAPLVLEALQQQRWPERRGSSQATTDPKAPIKTIERHLAVGPEYLFINERNTFGEGRRRGARSRNDWENERGLGFQPNAYHRPNDDARYTRRDGVYVRDQ